MWASLKQTDFRQSFPTFYRTTNETGKAQHFKNWNRRQNFRASHLVEIYSVQILFQLWQCECIQLCIWLYLCMWEYMVFMWYVCVLCMCVVCVGCPWVCGACVLCTISMSQLGPFTTWIIPMALRLVGDSMMCGEGSHLRTWRPELESSPSS